VLEPDRPTLIITEGLVNYFDLPTISGFWQQLVQLGQIFPAAWYLTDLFPNVPNMAQRPLVKVARTVLGAMTQAQVTVHFTNRESIEKGFGQCGFQQVQVHRPEQFNDLLPLPRSRARSPVRVVEARIK
jgi:O-methyltransferase involved in polyketide biosynthesis